MRFSTLAKYFLSTDCLLKLIKKMWVFFHDLIVTQER